MNTSGQADRSDYHILLPLANLTDVEAVLTVAHALVQSQHARLTALCVVEVAEEKSLSEGAIEARRRRQMLENVASAMPFNELDIRTTVRVSHHVWEGIHEVASAEGTSLLLLAWKGYTHSPERIFGRTIDEIMANPPCDVAVFKQGSIAEHPRILVPVRGGPYAELALGLAEALCLALSGQITVMHAVPSSTMAQAYERGERPFMDLMQKLSGRANLQRIVTARGDPAQAILSEAVHHDLVIMGASASVAQVTGLGPVTEHIAQAIERPMLVTKTRQTPPPFPAERTETDADISSIVDKWFAENTFHAAEFSDVARLVDIKQKQGLTISLGLPTLNEELTIGNIIKVLKRDLMERHPLLDEIIVIDSRSSDHTVEIARSLDVPVYIHQDVLPGQGANTGKGEALWKSLHVLNGDIIAWIDTDIANIHPKFVYGLVGPLLKQPRLQYVKGFYRRPLRSAGEIQSHGGGRVTELTARPLINLFFPQLSGIIQPLSGEYAGRRTLLERIPFFTGYGVETGLLVDIAERCGLSALAQVDLQERIHRNQSLTALSRMAFVIIQVFMRRLEDRHRLRLLEDINRSMKMIQYERNRLCLEVRDLYDVERPPIFSIPEYRAAHRT